MVVRLEGIVNGATVTFSRKTGDIWEAGIPSALNGIYIVELTAYDDAGNVSFVTKYILTINFELLTASLQACDYQSEIQSSTYDQIEMLSSYYALLCDKQYSVEVEAC